MVTFHPTLFLCGFATLFTIFCPVQRDALQDISDVISDSKTELGSPDLLELMAKAAAFIEHAGKIQQRELNDSAIVNKEQDEAQPQSVTT